MTILCMGIGNGRFGHPEQDRDRQSRRSSDFDYKARDNIGTWLVGKVAQDRAIERMRNLSSRPATQPTGHFFVLANGQSLEIKSDRSLMATEQMSEQEVAELAHTGWPGERRVPSASGRL